MGSAGRPLYHCYTSFVGKYPTASEPVAALAFRPALCIWGQRQQRLQNAHAGMHVYLQRWRETELHMWMC